MKNIRKSLEYVAVSSMLFAPAIAMADNVEQGNIIAFLETIKKAIDIVIPIMVALALIYFIYGLAEYILESGETSKIQEGRTRMIYGTIAMFVLVSIWELVVFLQKSIGVSNTDRVPTPRVPSVGE